jgi:hypothetical protein
VEKDSLGNSLGIKNPSAYTGLELPFESTGVSQ